MSSKKSGPSAHRMAMPVERAREAFHALLDISALLNTGLDREALLLCVRLCEAGVNPDALAIVITEIRREAASIVGDDADNQEQL